MSKHLTRANAGTCVVTGILMFLVAGNLAAVQPTSPLLLSSGTGTVRTGDGFSLGTTFTVGSADQTILDLGVFDGANPPGGSVGDGLLSSIPVGLFDSAGNLIASATVPSGTGATLLNGFRYVSITPISLTSGNTYTLAAYYSSSDADTLLDQGGSPSTSTAFQNYLAAFTGSNSVGSLSFPTGHTNGVAYVGPNLEFAVPEPAASLMTLGGLCLFGIRSARRRRRHPR